MLDIKKQVEYQVNGQINSFKEFFIGYSNNENYYKIVISSYYNTYLLLDSIIRLSFNVLYTLLKDDLFEKLFNSDLLKFAWQEIQELSNKKSIYQFYIKPKSNP